MSALKQTTFGIFCKPQQQSQKLPTGRHVAQSPGWEPVRPCSHFTYDSVLAQLLIQFIWFGKLCLLIHKGQTVQKCWVVLSMSSSNSFRLASQPRATLAGTFPAESPSAPHVHKGGWLSEPCRLLLHALHPSQLEQFPRWAVWPARNHSFLWPKQPCPMFSFSTAYHSTRWNSCVL